jgi:hypothetical protein
LADLFLPRRAGARLARSGREREAEAVSDRSEHLKKQSAANAPHVATSEHDRKNSANVVPQSLINAVS